jgi:SAM-dependent methyltransferase
MSATRIKQERDDLIQRYGSWTSHCIHLGDDVYTIDEPQVDARLPRYLQIAADMVSKPLHDTRVLDLACLEGKFGIEFALQGAKVVAIEGREANLAKTRFAKNILSLNNIELVQDDVRNLSPQKYGAFDVVLCLGILYHMDTPDVMELTKRIYEVCSRVAIIDTHFSVEAKKSFVWEGHTYWGSYFEEHKLNSTEEERLSSLWTSMGNLRSFILTPPSICNLLRHVGFTSVYECLNPYEHHNPNWPLPPKDDRRVVLKDRTTFVAVKGSRRRLMSSPITDASPEIDRPESPQYYATPLSAPGRAPSGIARKLLQSLPEPTQAVLRSIYHLGSKR